MRARAQFARDNRSNLQVIGPEPESPGKASRTRGPSDTGLNHKGQLFDPAGRWTWAGVAQDIWSILQGLGPDRVSPGTAGRTCGPTDPSPC